jgi:3-deoxy-D-manno-octulosonate 8-phosphate phosphatase (KDO 8-P phosphatase)
VYSGIAPDQARRIRLVALDVDGVLTENGVYIGTTAGGETVEFKRFDILDGLGIDMLRRAGMVVALISGRYSAATEVRAAELGIECFQAPGGRKLPAFRELLERYELSWDEVAFLADDLADLPALRRVALPVAVANAVPEVIAEARWQTRRRGGAGAVREFAEALLKARGEWAALVEAYCRDREGIEYDHHD